LTKHIAVKVSQMDPRKLRVTPRFLAILLAGLSLPLPALADEVVVFAAASLKNAMDQIATDFTAATGHKVTVSYAGSGQLAKQIIEGAPGDLFISANQEWMNEIEAAGEVAEGTRRDLLGNTLVLIAHGKDATPIGIGAATDLASLLGENKLAMAMVDSVPAGQYGKAALENLGQWDAVAPKVAQSDNVRAALALVSTGEAPYGIVYATDAAADDNVTVIGAFPQYSYPPIIYPAALTKGAADAADRDFLGALSADAARASFEAQGFTVLR
jgi:molybdate transport system substrate-binding protein